MVTTRNQSRDENMTEKMKITSEEMNLGSLCCRLSKSMEGIFERLAEPEAYRNRTDIDNPHSLLTDGWDHPDAWAPGNPAIDASPLMPLLTKGAKEIGYPEDPYPDTPADGTNENTPLSTEEYTDLQNLATLFRKETLCCKKVKYCTDCELQGVAGVVKAAVTDYKSPSGFLPPLWILEIGELIWKKAAREWQGLVAAQIRSEAIHIRSLIISLKLDIKERYPQRYEMITHEAYKLAMEQVTNRKTKVPPNERFFVANGDINLIEYLREQEGTDMTEQEKERVRICMNPKKKEARIEESPVDFVFPPPVEDTPPPQTQNPEESQPPCGQQITLTQDSEERPAQEEERLLFLSQENTPSHPEQIDKIAECHNRIDSVAKAVERIENILAQCLPATAEVPPPPPQAPREQREERNRTRQPTTKTKETATEIGNENRHRSVGTITDMVKKKKNKVTQTKNDRQIPPRGRNRQHMQERINYGPWRRNTWVQQYREPRNWGFEETGRTAWRTNHQRPSRPLNPEERIPQRWNTQQRQQEIRPQPRRWIPQNRWSYHHRRGNTQWDQEQQGGRTWQERDNGNWGWRW